MGYETFHKSRLILNENIATSQARDALAEAFIATQTGQILLIGGKGVAERDPYGNETSINPIWRNTSFHYCGGERPTTISKSDWDAL